MKHFEFFDAQVYEQIDKISDSIIWSCDAEFQLFHYISQSVKKVLGYSQNDMIKKKCSQFFDDKSYGVLKEKAIHCLNKNTNDPVLSYHIVTWKHQNGESVPLYTTLYMNSNKKSKKNVFYAVSKRVDTNLAFEKPLFSELFEKSDDMFVRLHYPSFDFGFISNSSVNLTGYSPEELKEKRNGMENLLLPEWKKFYNEKINEIVNNKAGSFEYRIKTKKQEIKWIKQFAVVATNIDGKEIMIEALLSDITYEKEIESEFKENQRKMFTLLSNLPGMVYRCKNDKNWTMEFVSHGVKELTGYFPEDFIEESKVTFGNIIHPLDRDYVWDEIQKALEERKAYKLIYRIIGKNGSVKWVWEHGRGVYSLNNELKALEGFIGDFDQQKKAEDENKKNEERLLLILELSKKSHMLSEAEIAHLIIQLALKLTESKNGYIHFINKDQNTVQLYIWDRNTISICPVIEKADTNENFISDSIKTRQAQIHNEFDEKELREKSNGKKNKMLRYMSISFTVDSKVRMVIGVENKDYDYNESDASQLNQIAAELWNILERKKDQQALYMEKERISITLKSIQTGVLSTNESGIIILYNESACKILGKKDEDIKDKFINDVLEITDIRTHQNVENIFSEIIRENNCLLASREYKLNAEKTSERIITLSGIPVFDSANRFMGIVIVLNDITTQVKMEEELFKIQKLESIGNLAGSIAHDFNNLLNGIFGYIDLAHHYSESKDEQEEYLQNALAVMDKAKALTKQLLTFSKGGNPQKEIVNLRILVRDTVMYLIRKTGIKPDFVIEQSLFMVKVDKAQIVQVIDCLTINAIQAMPDGGNLTVKLYNADSAFIESNNLQNIPYAVIEMIDTGIGIKQENSDKIFDLFFTTKENKSGLGLAISYSIIKKHNGKISVRSMENKGTTVFVILPAIKDYIETAQSPSLNSIDIKKQLKILMMDDIEYNRSIVEKILCSYGHIVKCVKSGEEALDEIKKAYDDAIPYDCAILDLTVPGSMGGKEVVLMLDREKYTLKLIATSGYAEDPILADPEKYGFHGKLEKPFVKENLLKLLYDIMP